MLEQMRNNIIVNTIGVKSILIKGNEKIEEKPIRYKIKNISVEDLDIITAARKYKDFGILNFAHGITAGGNFFTDCKSQESALCLNSCLYNSIKTCTDYYTNNKRYKPLYSNDIIVSKNVQFLDSTKHTIISSTPVDVSNINYFYSYMIGYTMQYRIQRIIAVCHSLNLENIILGAYGCGLSKNEPESIARMFSEELYGFDTVIFAIPKEMNRNNYITFKNIFERSKQ